MTREANFQRGGQVFKNFIYDIVYVFTHCIVHNIKLPHTASSYINVSSVDKFAVRDCYLA